MSYRVKVAVFQPWKAPVPYATLAGSFATTVEAAEAGAEALAPVTELELNDLASGRQPRSERAGRRRVTSINVPQGAVHGYLIYDEQGLEVFNWTTLDVAVDRAAKG